MKESQIVDNFLGTTLKDECCKIMCVRCAEPAAACARAVPRAMQAGPAA